MKPKLVMFLLRANGWRIWTVISVITLLLVELIISVMDLVLKGEILRDDLLIGLVAVCLVTLPSVIFMNYWLAEFTRFRQRKLEDSAKFANIRLSLAIENSKMMIWELDLARDELHIDHDALSLLGMSTENAPHNVQSLLEHIHPDDRASFMTHFQAALGPGDPLFSLEYRVAQYDGQWGWVHCTGKVIQRDAAGNPLTAVGTTININARKQAEQQFIRSETLLRSTLGATDEGILMIAQDGKVLSANQRFMELWHVPQEQADTGKDDVLLAHVLEQLVEPEVFLSQVRRLYDSDEEARDTLHFKDGRVFARYTRALLIGEERGRIWCFKDITEQEHTQAALAEREEVFRSIFSQANDSIFLIDPETQGFVEFNDVACATLGYSRNEFAQLTLADIQAEMSTVALAEKMRSLIEVGPTEFETLHRHKDGSMRNVRVSCKAITLHGRIYSVSTSTDITERKQAEESLRASEQKLLTILDNADVYIYLKDIEGRYLFANRRMREFWRLEMGDIVGYGDEKFFDAETNEKIRISDSRVLNNGETLKAEASNIVPATGKTATYLSTKLPLRHEDGSIYALCGIFTDITERKQMEVALADSNNLLRAILDSVPVRIFWKDKELRYLGCNTAFARDAGEKVPQDIIGKDDYQLGWKDQAELYRADDSRVMESGVAKLHYDEPQTTPGGKIIWLRTSKVPLRNADNETIGILGLYQEITEQKLAEIALLESEKRLNLALDAAHMGVWEFDCSSKKLYWSPEIYRHLGLEHFEPLQELLLSIVHPDDLNIFQEAMRRAVKERVSYFAEYRLVVNGKVYWTEDRGEVLYDAQGNPLKVTGTSQDITERIAASQKIQALNDDLSATLQAVPDLLFELSLSGEYINVWAHNPELLVKQKKLLIGRTVSEMLTPEATNIVMAALQEADEKGYSGGQIIRLSLPAGDSWFELSTAAKSNAGDNHKHFIMVSRDITERKQADATLRASEQKMLTILDNVDSYIYLKDIEGRYLFANRPVRELWHEEMENIVGCADEKFFDAPTAANIRRNDKRVLELGETLRAEETNTVPVTGKTAVYLSTKLPLRREDGSIYALCGISTNITERKKAELELAEREAQLRTLIEVVPDSIQFKDGEGRWLIANSICLRLFGLEGKAWQNLSDTEIGVRYPQLAGAMASCRSGDEDAWATGEIFRTEELVTDPQGNIKHFDVIKVPLFDDQHNRKALVIVARDFTAIRNASETLRASEAHANNLANMLRMMCDNVPDMIWAKDMNKCYTFVNKAICEQLLSATDTDEPIGKDDMFFARRERERYSHRPQWHNFGELCQDSDAATLALGKPSQFDEFGNVQGKFLYLDVHKAPFVNDKGEVIGVVGSARDVTAQKAAEEKLLLASLVLENSSEAMFVTDADGHMLDINPAFTKLTGYGLDEVLGKRPNMLSSGRHGPDFYREMWAEISSTGRWQGEIWNCRKNGEIYPEWLTINTIYHNDGPVYRRVALFTDITERQQALEQLRTTASELALANMQIEQERAQLAARVEERTAQLQYANHAKDSFLATMSHEIRTPLGGLLGMIELLGLSQLDDKQSETLQVAQKSGKSLLRIVDDILDWSKIEAGKLVLAPRVVSISDMLRGVMSTYAQLATQKGIQMKLVIDPDLGALHIFDPLRLSQILNNFTSNALKFTERGIVQINADRLTHHDGHDMVRFSVKDSGVGINLEHQKRLFRHYEQASADTARMYGGTGLGLSICRSLAELLGGTIEVESISGIGSTFSIALSLPVANVAASGEQRSRQVHANEASISPLVADDQHISVLIVDDHPVNRMLLKQQLDVLGLHVDAAGDGVEALALWQTGNFDLVITDCHMPEMDGYELTNSIRDLERQTGAKRVPIIAWTANVLTEEVEHCHSAGMDDLLTKPTELADLREKLLKWLVKAHVMTRPSRNALSSPVEQSPITTGVTLDVGVLKKISKRHDALVELLQEFNVQNRMDIDNLNAALQAGNPSAVVHSAHRIKGASRMVGALELEGICMDIEKAAKQGDMQVARATADTKLGDAVKRLEEVIGRFIAG